MKICESACPATNSYASLRLNRSNAKALWNAAPPGDTGMINHATTPNPLISNTTQHQTKPTPTNMQYRDQLEISEEISLERAATRRILTENRFGDRCRRN